MGRPNHQPRTLFALLAALLLFMLISVVSAQPQSNASYIPLRLANGTFDPLQTTPEQLGAPEALLTVPTSSSQSDYYIVQFDGPITEEMKTAVTDAGAEILSYVPDYAFVVRLNDSKLSDVQNVARVRWVGDYDPFFRLAPSLFTDYVETGTTETLALVVLLPPDVEETAVVQAINTWGGTVTAQAATHWKTTLRIELSSDYLVDLANLHDVQWVEPYVTPQLFNSRAGEVTNAETLWDTYGLYGEGQIVAVADSGFDQGSTAVGSMHPDFEDGSSNSRVLNVYDTAGDGNVADDADANGHGTHVAGTVLGNGLSSNGSSNASDPANNSFSNNTDAGVAPKASLVLQATWNNVGNGLVNPADLNDLFSVPYTNNGARIHTNSWGSTVYGQYTSSSRDVDEFTWDNPDMLILFAAGNDGEDLNNDGVVDLDSLGAPGTAKNALTVGASENNRPSISTTYYNPMDPVFSTDPIFSDPIADNIDGMAAFSSRGYTDDGRVKPDIVAPGTAIFSTCAAVTGISCSQGDYTYKSGTSMATPHVAGAAALAREYFTDWLTITPSGSLLKATLLNGAVDMQPGQYGTGSEQEITMTRPSPQAGWGRLDLEQALFRTAPYRTWYWDVGNTTTIEYPWSGLQSGDVVSYTFDVSQTGNVSATLVWNDYPGSPQTNGSLVNDLDLQIEGPGSTLYYPNHASQNAVYYLSYDDGFATGATAWGGAGREFAVRFTPGNYPAELDRAQLRMYSGSAGTVSFGIDVYDDDGTPGTELCSIDTNHTFGGGYENVVVDLSTCNGGSPVTITEGDLYIAFRQITANNPYLAYDEDTPIDNRSWDFNGATWSQNTTRDYMIMAGFTNPATSFDRVNNVVGIDIPNAATGTYTATLSGYNVPFGPQPYAFVLSAPGRLLGTETVTRTINGPGDYIFGNTGISMTFTTENVDTVSVTVRRDQFPTADSNDPVINRRYDITTAGGSGVFNASVSFSYEDAELNSLTESNLQLYRWDGSNWQPHTPDDRDTGANTVRKDSVTAFSSWVLGTPTPTAVSLTTTDASPTSSLWSILLAVSLLAMATFIAYRRRHTA